VEPVGATGRKPRQQYHQHEQQRAIYSFGYFPVHSVFPVWPSLTELSAIQLFIMTIEIAFLD
jgi:hypothetical protein